MCCGYHVQLLRPQPVANTLLWRAAPAEGEFRFVIVPVQPEMGLRDVDMCVPPKMADVGMCVPPEMAAGVGGKTATRLVCLEG